MKIIIDKVPKTMSKEVMESRIKEYSQRGIELKMEIRGDKVLLFYIEDVII